jgi:hypothetical protein
MLFQTAVIAMDAWTTILDMAGDSKPRNYNPGLPGFDGLVDWLANPEKYKALVREKYYSKKDEDSYTDEDIDRMYDHVGREKAGVLFKVESYYNPIHMFSFADKIMKRLTAGEDPEVVRASYAGFFDEHKVLDYLGRNLFGQFLPHRYCGQDYSNELGMKSLYVSIKTNLAITKLRDEFEEAYGDGDEEEEGEDEYVTLNRKQAEVDKAMQVVLEKYEALRAFRRNMTYGDD